MLERFHTLRTKDAHRLRNVVWKQYVRASGNIGRSSSERVIVLGDRGPTIQLWKLYLLGSIFVNTSLARCRIFMAPSCLVMWKPPHVLCWTKDLSERLSLPIITTLGNRLYGSSSIEEASARSPLY
ncbi:jg10568 [Pararge aegeria aegeria]|uniref:Jg10568 protein n=1 Tax=Pararge aegeria aegeria TaxID=348720 RepID=A0A8S4RAA9_9NEOP|nr:jg10568 [Pararge aegeria aegeria]